MEREGRGRPEMNTANERLIRSFKERHFIWGDRQIPDHDENIEGLLYRVITDVKPTHIWENGDGINATRLSTYGFTYDTPTFSEEIDIYHHKLKKMKEVATRTNPNVKITLLLGNHELRLQKWINRHGQEIADLRRGGEKDKVLTIPYLLKLKELGIGWVDYWEEDKIGKETIILHGDIVSQKSGVTAMRTIEKFGKNTITNHTHRLGLVFKTQSEEVKFGMECGSLCKRKMKQPYIRRPDWQNGFGFLGVDRDNKLHPQVIPIIDGRFAFGGKVYK